MCPFYTDTSISHENVFVLPHTAQNSLLGFSRRGKSEGVAVPQRRRSGTTTAA
jgi:hypothetical protein